MKTEERIWPWASDVVFAGGGKKLDRPAEQGFVKIEPDGALSINPEDDYYQGRIEPTAALELARALIIRPGAEHPPKDHGYLLGIWDDEWERTRVLPSGLWAHDNDARTGPPRFWCEMPPRPPPAAKASK